MIRINWWCGEIFMCITGSLECWLIFLGDMQIESHPWKLNNKLHSLWREGGILWTKGRRYPLNEGRRYPLKVSSQNYRALTSVNRFHNPQLIVYACVIDLIIIISLRFRWRHIKFDWTKSENYRQQWRRLAMGSLYSEILVSDLVYFIT